MVCDGNEAEAVIVPALWPKVTLFELDKARVVEAVEAPPFTTRAFTPSAAPAAPPEIVTALPFWLRVMLLPPASVSVPLEIWAIAPAVLPDRVILWRF